MTRSPPTAQRGAVGFAICSFRWDDINEALGVFLSVSSVIMN